MFFNLEFDEISISSKVIFDFKGNLKFVFVFENAEIKIREDLLDCYQHLYQPLLDHVFFETHEQ